LLGLARSNANGTTSGHVILSLEKGLEYL
jgi:hypothetical protein